MTSKNQLKDLVKQIIKEIAVVKKLKEVSATGGVSCPSSKMAFGKVKDRVSRQAGMIPVSGPSAEVNEGWAMGQYTPEQTNSLKLLSKAGFREISSFPASPDAHGEGQTGGVVVVVQRKHSKFGTTQCEVEPDGSCNGQTVADFIRSGINEGKKPTNRKFENPAPEETKTINEPIERDDVDYINKEKKAAINKKDTKKVKSVTKIQQLIKRSSPYSRLDEEADLNLKAEKDKFEAGVEANEFKLKSEEIKLIKSKLLNKQFTAHASKGYGQVKRDYTITVVDVNIADYYGEYQIILKGNDKKEYFVDTDYKLKPVGGGEQPTEQPAAPAVQAAPANPESEKAPAPTVQPKTDLSKEIQK